MFEGWFGSWQVVHEGQAGLLYQDGVYRRTVPPGRVRVGPREQLHVVVMARQALVVAGQEIASSDGFQPRLTAVVAFEVVDAHRAQTYQDGGYMAVVLQEVQFALRTLAIARKAEDLATSMREPLDAELLASVRAGCTGLGVDIVAVRLRDVALPADLRRLITGVERARREGQVALERAHAEQAALRALANAARMLRNNPELQNLRLLQAIGTAGAPTTIVLGTPGGIVPLRKGPEEPSNDHSP